MASNIIELWKASA